MCSVGNTTVPSIELLVLGLAQLDGHAALLAVGASVHLADLLPVHVVLRLEAKALAVTFFPGGGAQVGERDLALAAVELRDLTELQGIAFAG